MCAQFEGRLVVICRTFSAQRFNTNDNFVQRRWLGSTCSIFPTLLYPRSPFLLEDNDGPACLLQQRRWRGHHNTTSLLQQHYNRLAIRRKYKRAIRKGTLCWDKGQVKIPPISIMGFDPPKKHLPPLCKKTSLNLYKGKFEDIRAPRIRFLD